MPANVHLVHGVVCDDVRTEILSKETIVGVYSAGILIPTVPWAVMLCLWMTVIWSGDGSLPIEVRVLNPSNTQIGEQKGEGIATLQGFQSTITFRGLFFNVDVEGIYTFQWKAGGGEWQTVRQLPIYVFREQATSS